MIQFFIGLFVGVICGIFFLALFDIAADDRRKKK